MKKRMKRVPTTIMMVAVILLQSLYSCTVSEKTARRKIQEYVKMYPRLADDTLVKQVDSLIVIRDTIVNLGDSLVGEYNPDSTSKADTSKSGSLTLYIYKEGSTIKYKIKKVVDTVFTETIKKITIKKEYHITKIKPCDKTDFKWWWWFILIAGIFSIGYFINSVRKNK